MEACPLFLYIWSCVGLMVSALVSRSSCLCSNPGWRHCVVVLSKTLNSHSAYPGVQISTTIFIAAGYPEMDFQGEVTIHIVTSCFRNCDKLQPDGPLSLHADLTITLPLLVYEVCFSMRFNTDRKILTWPEGVKKLLTTVIICVSRMGKSFGLSSTPTNSFTVLRICTD